MNIIISQFELRTSDYANYPYAEVETIIPSSRQKTAQKELLLIPKWRNHDGTKTHSHVDLL